MIIDLARRNGRDLPLGCIVEFSDGDGVTCRELLDDCGRYVEAATGFRTLCKDDDMHREMVLLAEPEELADVAGEADACLLTCDIPTADYADRLLATAAQSVALGGLVMLRATVSDRVDAKPTTTWTTTEALDAFRRAGLQLQRIARTGRGDEVYCLARRP